MGSRASVVLLATLLARPAWAAAQQPLPSYATARETIEGTIASLDGKYTLTLDDVRGFTDSVTLHPGTTVDPEGVSLSVGEFVLITGHADGKTFAADDVDTDVPDPDASAYAYATDAGEAAGAPLPAFFPAFAYAPPPFYGRFPGPSWLPPVSRTGSPPPHPPVALPHRPVSPTRPVAPPRPVSPPRR
jgi:hypothetical protein